MKKKYLLAAMTVLAMGITACSFESKEGSTSTESTVESETSRKEIMETESTDMKSVNTELPETEASEEEQEKNLAEEEIIEGDPIVGIVDRYENDIIVIRDGDDEDIIYYFSTQNAQVIEGDSPIAAGDTVEITYRGVQGDEEHPGMAVKVVAE